MLLLILAIFMIIHPQRTFGDNSLSLEGYYKNFFTIIDPPGSNQQDNQVIGSVNNRLRLNLYYNPIAWLSFNFSYSPTLQIQDPSLFDSESQFFPESNSYRVSDLSSRLYPSEDDSAGSFGISQNMDRALITIRVPWADIYAGRQAISWGSARAVNPTDIIAPYSFDRLDTEERRGVDAIRIRIPTGMMGEVDIGVVFGEDFGMEKNAIFLRGRFYKLSTDLSLLLMEFRENLMCGVDIARNLGGAGLWLESAYVFANAFQDKSPNQGDDYFRGTIGIDYSFNREIYTSLEYHWNQAGIRKPEDYLENLSAISYREGANYLMGGHYLLPSATYQLTPLIPLNCQLLINLLDPSAFATFSLEYNIAQNIYISVGALIGIGDAPKTENINGLLQKTLKSEFGSYPKVYYSSFRIYF
jgi:hypothetical protein